MTKASLIKEIIPLGACSKFQRFGIILLWWEHGRTHGAGEVVESYILIHKGGGGERGRGGGRGEIGSESDMGI